MKKFYGILAENSLFKNVGGRDLDAALKHAGAYIKHYGKNGIIRDYTGEVTEIGVVVKGNCYIAKMDENGNRIILLEVKTGKSFGEAVAFSGMKNIFISIIAATDCSIVFIPVKKILEGLHTAFAFNITFTENLIKLLAQKSIALHIKTEILSQKTTRGKLMSYFEYESKNAGSKTFKIPFTMEELADYLSVNRSAMAREIGRMRDEGILDYKKNDFRITGEFV